jgi:integrase
MITLAKQLQEVHMASVPSAPRPRKHKGGRGIWRTRWYDDKGKRRDKTFGYVDEVSPPQAKARFRAWLQTWASQDRVKNPGSDEFTYTVAQLAVDFLEYAKGYYVKNGEMTSTVWNVAYAMQAMVDAWSDRTASSITGPELAALIDSTIRGERNGKEFVLTAKTVGDRLHLMKQSFRWARRFGLISAANLFDLMQVKAPVANRSEARASKKIRPVDEHWLAVTKDFAPAPVATMIDIQWLTGMRPESVCIMRSCDIDMSVPADRKGVKVWLYRPYTHKMEHAEKDHVIPLGPKCQELISPFLNRATDALLFSPAESEAERQERKREARKTPLYPSHLARYAAQAASAKRAAAGDRYTTETYRRAIHYACAAAQRDARKSDPEAIVPKWNPNQLRHSAATRLNKAFALEDVSVLLNHADLKATRIYAEKDYGRAIKIARRVG